MKKLLQKAAILYLLGTKATNMYELPSKQIQQTKVAKPIKTIENKIDSSFNLKQKDEKEEKFKNILNNYCNTLKIGTSNFSNNNSSYDSSSKSGANKLEYNLEVREDPIDLDKTILGIAIWLGGENVKFSFYAQPQEGECSFFKIGK